MSNRSCGILIPRFDHYTMCERWEDTACQNIKCSGPHRFTVNGRTICWEDDWDCGCCTPEERLDDGCFVWWEEAQGIEAPSGGETTQIGSTEGESPVAESDAPK